MPHRYLLKKTVTPFCACLAIHSASGTAGDTQHTVNKDTGIPTWETATDGVHLRLTQISPDQARAFMLARGLDKQSVEEFAHTCVFMSVLRNDSSNPIKYCMAEWRYVTEDGLPQTMLSKHDWLARWQPRKFSRPVKLGFEWSQLPFEQTFSPGDWNQGMTTFDLPAGSRFDVIYRWWRNGKLQEGKLSNVECPAKFD